jgi:hypothetical protein
MINGDDDDDDDEGVCTMQPLSEGANSEMC